MKKLIGVLVLAAACVGVYYANESFRTSDGRSILHVAKPVAIDVQLSTPVLRDVVRTVQAPGDVEAFNEVDISSEVVGKIVEMPVVEGDFVSAGDLLCRLDDADYRARVLSAEANVARLAALIKQAEAELATAELDWDQIQRLRETSATSSSEVARYRSALVGAQAVLEMRRQELVQSEAALQSAREDLDRTVLTAPIDGIISQLFAEKGEVVVTGTMNNPGTRIMVLSDLSKLQVRCRVDEADAPLVQPDQPARIYLQSDSRRSVSGRVLRVGAKGTKPAGRDVVTFETLVLVDAPDNRVRPGMSASVEIEVARRDQTLTVPIEAVVFRKRRDLPEAFVRAYDERLRAAAQVSQHLAEYVKVVFCVDDELKAAPRMIETGINDALHVEVVSGLGVDDNVVIGPYRSLDQIRDGSLVRREEKPADQPPATTDIEPDAERSAASQPAAGTEESASATSQPAAARAATPEQEG